MPARRLARLSGRTSTRTTRNLDGLGGDQRGLALVLEQYRSDYGANLDLQSPLPSTLRGSDDPAAEDKEASTSLEIRQVDGAVQPAGGRIRHRMGIDRRQDAVAVIEDRRLVEGSWRPPDPVGTTCSRFPRAPRGRYASRWPGTTSRQTPTRQAQRLRSWQRSGPGAGHPGGTEHFPWQLDQKIVNPAPEQIPVREQPGALRSACSANSCPQLTRRQTTNRRPEAVSRRRSGAATT